MKLCIPSRDDRGLESETVGHFGRAPFFTIVDTESGQIDTRANPNCHTHPGVCQHVDTLRALGVDAVAGAGVGRRAWQGLHDAGIEVYASPAPHVADVVEAVKAGTVEAMNENAACGGHGHGHGHGHGQSHGHGHGHGEGHQHEKGHGAGRGRCRTHGGGGGRGGGRHRDRQRVRGD
jgi:predicted Fe-Mo cluster-binding NifX family protein